MENAVIVIYSTKREIPVYSYWYDDKTLSRNSAVEQALFERWGLTGQDTDWRLKLMVNKETYFKDDSNKPVKVMRTGDYTYKINF